jgi:hypothetical protein
MTVTLPIGLPELSSTVAVKAGGDGSYRGTETEAGSRVILPAGTGFGVGVWVGVGVAVGDGVGVAVGDGVGEGVGDGVAPTVIETVSLSPRDPSETWKVIREVPTWEYVGVHEKDRALASNDAPDGRVPVEYVSRSPSGSVASAVKVSADPTVADLDPMAERTGARFTLFAVMVIVSLSLRTPSETAKITGYVPAWL